MTTNNLVRAVAQEWGLESSGENVTARPVGVTPGQEIPALVLKALLIEREANKKEPRIVIGQDALSMAQVDLRSLCIKKMPDGSIRTRLAGTWELGGD